MSEVTVLDAYVIQNYLDTGNATYVNHFAWVLLYCVHRDECCKSCGDAGEERNWTVK